MRNAQGLRWSAGALVAGAAGWLVAGALIVARPFGLRVEHVYSTLIPAVMFALFAGVGGLNAWLGGFRPKARRRSWFRGLSSGLEAMSSERDRAVGGAGVGDESDGLTARGVGVGAFRAGAVIVAASGLLMGGGTGMRSTVHLGWFLFFAGAAVIGIAVLSAEDLPRGAGALLAAGSLLVFPVAAVVLAGGTERPEAVGPLLPPTVTFPVVSLLLWAASGAAWAWLGAGLWRERARDRRPGGAARSR